MLLGHALLGLILFFALYGASEYTFTRMGWAFPPALGGIVLLFVLMAAYRCVPKPVSIASAPLLKHMSLFFLPAIVAIANYTDLIKAYPLALLLAIVVSTLVSLALTAIIANKLMHVLANNEH